MNRNALRHPLRGPRGCPRWSNSGRNRGLWTGWTSRLSRSAVDLRDPMQYVLKPHRKNENRLTAKASPGLKRTEQYSGRRIRTAAKIVKQKEDVRSGHWFSVSVLGLFIQLVLCKKRQEKLTVFPSPTLSKFISLLNSPKLFKEMHCMTPQMKLIKQIRSVIFLKNMFYISLFQPACAIIYSSILNPGLNDQILPFEHLVNKPWPILVCEHDVCAILGVPLCFYSWIVQNSVPALVCIGYSTTTPCGIT